MNITSALLIFYIIIAANFTGNLFSNQLRTFFSENKLAQHLIAFIMLLIIIMIFTNVKKIDQAILFALLGYMWFIFTTKLDVHFNVIILLLLLSAFIYDFKANEKTTEIETDPNLSKTQKEQLIQSQTNYRIYFILLILAVTAVGTTFYINKKSIQYGGGEFDVVKFIFY